jgi:glutamyl-tRNA reductase
MKSRVFTCVGLNHETSPVEERELLAFSPEELPAALARISERTQGAAILSTCNRTEIYATVAEGDGASLIHLLNEEKGANVDPSRFYVLQHKEAVAHLFRVAAGIDSMVLGESQILGQVREAMSAATAAGTLNGVLSRAFHSAVAVGKRARTETHIGRHAVSVSSAAVSLARSHIGSLDGKTVLVISAGSTGKLAARSLADASDARIVVANRTAARARELAGEFGPDARGVGLSQLPRLLPQTDVVITGTGAGHFILGPDEIRPAAVSRNGNGLLLIDVAVPRDIDPAVRDIPGISLFDIDDVEAVAEAGINGRKAEVRSVEKIIAEELRDFLTWWDSLDVVPVISALRERAEEIRLAELQKTLRRLPDLDDETRERIEAMTSAIVKKMLDRPIARLKDGADKGLYMEALEDLFDIHPTATRPYPVGRGPSTEIGRGANPDEA